MLYRITDEQGQVSRMVIDREAQVCIIYQTTEDHLQVLTQVAKALNVSRVWIITSDNVGLLTGVEEMTLNGK